MKGLMFLGAGSVLHGAGTKDLERLGGVMQAHAEDGIARCVARRRWRSRACRR